MVLSSKFSAINIKEFSNQTHNYSNKTLEEICHIPQTFKNIYDFFECYRIVAIKEIDAVVFELFLAASVVFLNSLVVICMVFGSNKKTCFDKILFGYCLVDGVTGLFDIPLYHIRDVFGYWPMGNSLAMVWTIYDNNINVNTSAHMLYASYARLRSIQSPKGYERELLLRKPYIVMLFIWIFSLSMWTIITCSIGLVEYDTAINFKPLYLQTIFNIFPWFTLLIAILAVAIAIYVLLLQKAQKSKKILKKDKIEKQGTNTFTLNSTNLTGSVVTLYTNSVISKKINALKKFHLKPSQKYFIIMGSYWIQWTPPCIVVLISPFIYIRPDISAAIYWMTYSVCLTDPFFVLTLNPNITFPRFWKKK